VLHHQRMSRQFLRLRAYEVGDEFVSIDGQRYLLIGFLPHTRKSGRKTQLAHWLGWCETCGWSFPCTSPGDAPPQQRHCLVHKAPGNWARGATRRGRWMSRYHRPAGQPGAIG
jgi:hypothetical protein